MKTKIEIELKYKSRNFNTVELNDFDIYLCPGCEISG